MIRLQLVRPLQRILDSKYHPSDALLFLFKLMYSALSSFKIQLKIERSLIQVPFAPWMAWSTRTQHPQYSHTSGQPALSGARHPQRPGSWSRWSL